VSTQQTADDDITALKQTITDTAKGKAEAEARASAAETEVAKAREVAQRAIAERTKSDKTAAVAAIAAGEQELANLENQLSTALASRDAAGVAKVTRALASAQTRLDQWTNQKARIENTEKKWLAEAEAQARAQANQPAQPAGGDINRYPPKSRAWLEAHLDVFHNPSKMKKVFAAHVEAEANDVVIESPEYFALIEQRVGLTKRKEDTGDDPLSDAAVIETDEVVDTRPVRDATAVAAAPSRNGGGGRSESPGRVRLTPSEQEIALASFSHLTTKEEKLKEYAKNKAALQREGRL
jgi:hypothetical protein